MPLSIFALYRRVAEKMVNWCEMEVERMLVMVLTELKR